MGLAGDNSVRSLWTENSARHVAVLAEQPGTDSGSSAAPPGVDAREFRLALLEDTYDVIADMERVTAALALCPPDQPEVEALTWPDTPVLGISQDSSPAVVVAALRALYERGVEQVGIVAGDAPDLPQLLLGKLFRGLGHGDVAVCPAEGGGLVALAARLPIADWFVAANVGLDSVDAVVALRATAPSKAALSVGPGWHRIRRPADIGRLDPGLEGWESTRAVLSGRTLP